MLNFLAIYIISWRIWRTIFWFFHLLIIYPDSINIKLKFSPDLRLMLMNWILAHVNYFSKGVDICYISTISNPSQTFRYDFNIFTSIDNFCSIWGGHHSLVFRNPRVEDFRMLFISGPPWQFYRWAIEIDDIARSGKSAYFSWDCRKTLKPAISWPHMASKYTILHKV